MVKLLCGPIVGQVTKTTACVLLEVDEDSPGLGCILRCFEPGMDNHGEMVGCYIDYCVERNMMARQPKVYKFENLKSGVKYQIRVPKVEEEHVFGEVQTMPADIKNCNIAVVSCDKRTYKPANSNMWETMWQRIQSKKDDIHVLLHIGDNVYMDGDASDNTGSNVKLVADDEGIFDAKKTDQSIPYVQARNILRGKPKNEWPEKRDEILEIYRQEYRTTFGRKYVALVLANVSNLMILDDHDIRDDFGGVPEDADPDSTEYYLGLLALQVFHEYQRALWDPDIVDRGTDDLNNEFVAISYGPVGIMMLDTRTVWSLYKSKRADNDLTYFGEEQMKEVKTRLNEREDIMMWVMVCPLPLLFLKKKLNQIAGAHGRADDLMGFINVRHQRDLESIFDLIQQWRKAKPGRELLLFSGDVHIAGFTDVYHNPPEGGKKELICRQITSSAINNERPGMVGMAAVRMLLYFSESYGDYTYKHYDWINKCNYAVLNVKQFTPELVYKVKLVHEEGLIVKRSVDKEWDMKSCVSANCFVCQVL